MYVKEVNFEQNMPIAFEAFKLGKQNVHCHKEVIEILMIMSGSATVKVSFEQFEAKEGDYMVIRQEDSHSVSATDQDCQIVSLFFSEKYFKQQMPYLPSTVFTCESFDLAKYRNETQCLRIMISQSIRDCALNTESSRESALNVATELLWILVSNYDMRSYYNRNWNMPYNKIEKFNRMTQYIFDHYDMKNLQEYIAKKEFYSKSYITHLFKEISANSFQDILNIARAYHSEALLIDSSLPILEISDLCGYSDVKYYTRNFKKWFHCTPSTYRKIYQPESKLASVQQKINDDVVIRKMQNFINGFNDETKYKAAITPLTVNANITVVKEQHIQSIGSLRFAMPDDAEKLLEIYAPYVLQSAVSFECNLPTISDFQNRISTIIEDYPYLVCQVEGVIVGYAYAHRFKERPAYSWNAELSVYVDVSFTGKGVGKTLYAALIRLLEQQNVQNLYAGIALPNDASEGLHTSFDFKLLGTYHNTCFKLGAWHHVALYEKSIGDYSVKPEPFIKITDVPDEIKAQLLLT